MLEWRRPTRVRTGVLGGSSRGAAALLVVAFVVAGCWVHASVPSDAEMVRSAEALEKLLPTLADLKVKEFRDQDWCRSIDYQGRAYSNRMDSASACNLFDLPPQAFDGRATDDWQAIRDALRGSGVSVSMVRDVAYGIDGKLMTARFDISAGDFDRYSYVYDPHNVTVKSPAIDTILLRRISHDWWFVSDDWN